MSVNELQILRNELDIYEPTGYIFEIPVITIPLLLGNCGAHFHDITGRQIYVARPPQDILDDILNPELECIRRRNNPGSRESHVLPRPGLGLLIGSKAIEPCGQGTSATRWSQAHIDLVKRSVICLRRQSDNHPLRQTGKILSTVEWPF